MLKESLLNEAKNGLSNKKKSEDPVDVPEKKDTGISDKKENWWTDWNKSQSNSEKKCEWIKLNTPFPIIWDCIKIQKWWEHNPTTAFPDMISALTKIVMSLILVVCFILIIVAGIMRASDNTKWAQDLLKKVAITILVLWFAWVILRLINPNFFW